MIVTADLHLREESEFTVFNEVLPGLESAAMVNNVDPEPLVAILGDIYHLRYRVSVKLQNRLLNFFRQSRANWFLLPGNHDQINPAGDNTLEVFSELNNVIVFHEPVWTEYGLWVPYRKNIGDIHKALTLPRPEKRPPIVWMHHGICGAIMNGNVRDSEGIPLDQFFEFKRVYCGHYHKEQALDHVQYLGSPYQVSASETGQIKAIGVVDINNLEDLYMREVQWGKRYHKFTLHPNTMPALHQFDSRDEIRIIAKDQDPEEVGKFFLSKGFSNVIVIPAQEDNVARLQVGSEEGLDGYAKGYIDQFRGELDADRLMGIYQEVVDGEV